MNYFRFVHNRLKVMNYCYRIPQILELRIELQLHGLYLWHLDMNNIVHVYKNMLYLSQTTLTTKYGVHFLCLTTISW